MGLDLDETGAVSKLGLQVSACAVGQAAAAIFASAVRGARAQDIEAALNAIQAWLREDGPQPVWPRFDALEAALAHPGRHGALILPWETAQNALSSA